MFMQSHIQQSSLFNSLLTSKQPERQTSYSYQISSKTIHMQFQTESVHHIVRQQIQIATNTYILFQHHHSHLPVTSWKSTGYPKCFHWILLFANFHLTPLCVLLSSRASSLTVPFQVLLHLPPNFLSFDDSSPVHHLPLILIFRHTCTAAQHLLQLPCSAVHM